MGLAAAKFYPEVVSAYPLLLGEGVVDENKVSVVPK
jgi:hypothetical protein